MQNERQNVTITVTTQKENFLWGYKFRLGFYVSKLYTIMTTSILEISK